MMIERDAEIERRLQAHRRKQAEDITILGQIVGKLQVENERLKQRSVNQLAELYILRVENKRLREELNRA
jgi:regulator of replication initiation timing